MQLKLKSSGEVLINGKDARYLMLKDRSEKIELMGHIMIIGMVSLGAVFGGGAKDSLPN